VQDAHLPERQAERVRRATAGHYGGDGGTNWGAVAGAGILGALLGAAATPRRWDQVVGEVAGQQLPFCVIDEVFKEGAALRPGHPLHLDPGCDVNPVSENFTTLDQDVGQVNPDAEGNPPVWSEGIVQL
jgi:hypothetical protein